MIPLNLTAYRLAIESKINPTRVSEIIHIKSGITADTALRFSKFFGNSDEFWMGIQDEYEILAEISLWNRVLTPAELKLAFTN